MNKKELLGKAPVADTICRVMGSNPGSEYFREILCSSSLLSRLSHVTSLGIWSDDGLAPAEEETWNILVAKPW